MPALDPISAGPIGALSPLGGEGAVDVSAAVTATGSVTYTGTAAVAATVGDPPVTAAVDAVGAVTYTGTAAGSATIFDSAAPPPVTYSLADVEGMLPYVHDEIPAVPYMVAMRALVDAARIFCSKSTAWRVEATPAITIVSRADYALQSPEGGHLVGVHLVLLGGVELPVVGASRAAQLAARFAGSPRPVAATVIRGGALRLIPAPTAEEDGKVLWAEVSLQPAPGATQIPEFLATQYAMEIGAGAKAILSAQANVPWSNPAAVLGYNRTFYAAAYSARRDLDTGNSGADSQVELRKWV